MSVQANEEAPPSFNEAVYGLGSGSGSGFMFTNGGVTTTARVTDEGQIAIHLSEKQNRLSSDLSEPLEVFQNRSSQEQQQQDAPPPPLSPLYQASSRPPRRQLLSRTSDPSPPPPSLNVLIQAVGSRGDIQPFVALGLALQQKWRHRVRIATHAAFRDMVEGNGLEFFDVGGDPARLMAYMVRHPGLVPGLDTITKGNVTEHREETYRMLRGCWRACIEAAEDSSINSKPFVADIIVANPPSFAHIHCAQKLCVPLHIMFTMPWSPTRFFPHPLANIEFSNVKQGAVNYLSYSLVEAVVWQGIGDVVNRFRTKVLNLEPISYTAGPALLANTPIPHTYCWSPTLIPNPTDWGSHISVGGFCFLQSHREYSPNPTLVEFLAVGSEPLYIGFGSIVIDDPEEMTSLIFEAIRITGQRALISQGWAALGARSTSQTRDVLVIGDVPHDWIFPRVSCVVHHGGAGTTAAGIAAGKPTVIVPFFGDQPFWGSMIAQAGAGPAPIPRKQLSANVLAKAITEALQPGVKERAVHLSRQIAAENGVESAAQALHRTVELEIPRCILSTQHAAVWKVKRTDLRVSALSAALILRERILKPSDLKLLRYKQYNLESGLDDPLTAAVASTFGGLGNVFRGLASIGLEPAKAVRLQNQRHAASRQAGRLSDPKQDQQCQALARPTPMTEKTGTQEAASHTGVAASSSTQGNRSATCPAPSLGESSDLMSQSNTEEDEDEDEEYVTKDEKEKQQQREALNATGSISATKPRSTDLHSTENANADSTDNHPTSLFNIHNLHVLGSAAKGLSVGLGKGGTLAVLHAAATPLDVIAATARGLHNTPKRYGDDTVRTIGRIEGFGSGLKAAGKAVGLGFYDGVTGLLTQPIQGARKEGATGFAKGFMKGALGIGFKPTAGAMGMFSLTYEGLNKEIHKIGLFNAKEYVRASRLAQGFDELLQTLPDQQEQMLNLWHSFQREGQCRESRKGREKTTAAY